MEDDAIKLQGFLCWKMIQSIAHSANAFQGLVLIVKPWCRPGWHHHVSRQFMLTCLTLAVHLFTDAQEKKFPGKSKSFFTINSSFEVNRPRIPKVI